MGVSAGGSVNAGVGASVSASGGFKWFGGFMGGVCLALVHRSSAT